MMTMSLGLRLRSDAANAFGITVIADTVAVPVDKGAVLSAVVPAVSAGIAKSVSVDIVKGTIFLAIISAVFAVIADAVTVLIGKVAAFSAVINSSDVPALTSSAVMSAVSRYGNARH